MFLDQTAPYQILVLCKSTINKRPCCSAGSSLNQNFEDWELKEKIDILLSHFEWIWA